MECLAEDLVFRFVSGNLPSSAIHAIDEHLAVCDDCRGLVADLARSPAGDPPGAVDAALATSPSTGRRDLESQSSDADNTARLPRPGETVGRYVVSRPIGMGGMGVVFLAVDPTLNRRLTIKLLRTDRQAERDVKNELLHEAQAMARLAHPNVVSVFDAGTFDDQIFLAMEFVEGSTLSHWLGQESRPWQEVLAVFLDAGRGLAAAHAVGIIHRDFKPSNVLVGNDGRVRVTDFGLARAVDVDGALEGGSPGDLAGDLLLFGEGASPAATRTGAIKGTPAYMAPEQFLRLRLDARTDQFSFCVALYKGLYRRFPFDMSNLDAHVTAVRTGKLEPPPLDGPIPRQLHDHVVKGLAVDPDARHASMKELLAALDEVRVALLTARPADPRPSGLASTSSRRWIAAAAVPSVLLLGAGAAWIAHAREAKRTEATRAVSVESAPAAPASTSPSITISSAPLSLTATAPTPLASPVIPTPVPTSAPRKLRQQPRSAPPKLPASVRYDDAPMEPAFARKK